MLPVLKRVALLGASVGLVVTAVWFMGGKLLFFPTKPAPVETAQNPQGTNTDASSSTQSAINFALESINMRQGEGGLELWRLKAHWANIRHEDNVIVVEKPKLDYTLSGGDGKHLFINSLKGEIDQTEQTIHFLGDVDAQYETNTVFGPTLVYNGTARTMSFTEPSKFMGEDMQGSADKIVWLIPSRIIEAKGNVVVHMQGKPALAGANAQENVAPEVPQTAEVTPAPEVIPAPQTEETPEPALPEGKVLQDPNAKVDNTPQDVQTMGATPVTQEVASKPPAEAAAKAVEQAKPVGETKAKRSTAPAKKKAPASKKATSPKKQKKTAKSVTKAVKKTTER